MIRAGGRDGSVMGLRPRSAPTFGKIDSTAPLVRARAVGLGGRKPDAQVLPVLVSRLGDSDPVVRLAAHEELRKRTGQDFGYLPWAGPEERSIAIERWRAWLSQDRAGQGVTPSPQLTSNESPKRRFRTASKRARRAILELVWVNDRRTSAEGSRTMSSASSLCTIAIAAGASGLVGQVSRREPGLCGGRDPLVASRRRVG